jgi:calcineurin-like phosphoesterase family protein
MKNEKVYWVTTDTHFEHKMIKEYENRPDDYNELIVKNWNNNVKPSDYIIHLGDVAFGNVEVWNKYIPRLNGNKILVKGNHDARTDTWYLDHGFIFVCEGFALNRFGKRIYFSHRPKIISEDYDYNVHGHLHGSRHKKTALPEKHILVALELNGYMPVNLKNLIPSN